jgi:DNA mismatch repair protein MutL
MSDVIKLLPDSVANQIAAGEVIQRPASVIKELVENAIDAGATSIQVIIKDSGRTLIQVVDNGAGMSPTDARLAFERHATSKITQANDLFALHTMGFRGEALASIAAVAQVDMRTMRHDDTIGTRIVISGSKVESQTPEACAPGTNMMVKNLFFNVPARRKFLKRDSVEMGNILHEFQKLALVNTNVEFTLIEDDVAKTQIPKGSFKQRISHLFGKTEDHKIIPVETDTSLVRISGFVGLPEYARKRNALQYMFVNGRYMRHQYFHKAVMQCYEQLISADVQPDYFLNFTVDPESIDVNIHPTKQEIKFENEQPIWQILSAAIKESLGRFNAVPAINFDVDDMPDIPAFQPDDTAKHDIEIDHSYNPFRATPITQNWEQLYENFSRERDKAVNIQGSSLNAIDGIQSRLNDDVDTVPDTFAFEQNQTPPTSSTNATTEATLDLGDQQNSVVTMQVKGRYIVSPTRNGILLVDQHRAHIKILYEQYLEMYRHGTLTAQRVIFPEVLHLTPAQNAIIEGITQELTDIGFDLSYLGDNAWSINGVPSVIDNLNPTETILTMIDNTVETGVDIKAETHERIALSLARSAAVKSGQALSQGEMDQILSDLTRLPDPALTPDGLTVMKVINIDDITNLFN